MTFFWNSGWTGCTSVGNKVPSVFEYSHVAHVQQVCYFTSGSAISFMLTLMQRKQYCNNIVVVHACSCNNILVHACHCMT